MKSYEFSTAPKHTAVELRRKPTKAYHQFVKGLTSRVCDVYSPDDEQMVMDNRQCRELVRNDGTATFMVHSTSHKHADAIVRDGYTTHGKGSVFVSLQPKPSFDSTCVLLAGPDHKDQARLNVHALAYRYGEDPENTAKVVFAFPVPHEDSSFGLEFDDTFLAHADGKMVIQKDEVGEQGAGTFYVPNCYILGYFDQAAQNFVYNPDFDMNSQSSESLTM